MKVGCVMNIFGYDRVSYRTPRCCKIAYSGGNRPLIPLASRPFIYLHQIRCDCRVGADRGSQKAPFLDTPLRTGPTPFSVSGSPPDDYTQSCSRLYRA